MTENKFKKDNGWFKAFENAVEGVVYAFTTQKNFRVHFVLSALAIILAFWLEIPQPRFLVLVLAIVIGLTIEMANTAFEKTIDLITEEWNEKARLVKDLSAGMMLVVSCGLAFIGLLILLPPLWQKFLGG